MVIDLASLWLITGVIAFLSGVANTIISHSNLQVKGIGYWAVFSFVFVAGILTSSQAGIINVSEWSSLSDILFITAFTSLYIGVREICLKQDHPWMLLAGIWLLASGLMFFTTSVSPDDHLRLAIFSLFVAVISAMSCQQILPRISSEYKGHISLFVIFSVTALFMVSKVVVTYAYGLPANSVGATQWVVATGILMLVSLIWFIFSVILIAAEKLQAELAETGYRDALTGLLNNKGIEETAQRVIKRNRRTQTPVTLMMIDIDFFRDMNDVYGYEFSNGVLQRVASLIDNELRYEDYSSRYQSDVFIIILEGASKEGMMIPAERILHALEREDLYINDTLVPCTVSIGISTSSGDQDFYDLVSTAHVALEEVKAEGGNGVKVSEDSL